MFLYISDQCPIRYFSVSFSNSNNVPICFLQCGVFITSSEFNHMKRTGEQGYRVRASAESSTKEIIIQGEAQIMPLFYYKMVNMQFCDITISYSCIPCDILGEMFKLKLELLHPYYYPKNHTQAGVTSSRPCIMDCDLKKYLNQNMSQ